MKKWIKFVPAILFLLLYCIMFLDWNGWYKYDDIDVGTVLWGIFQFLILGALWLGFCNLSTLFSTIFIINKGKDKTMDIIFTVVLGGLLLFTALTSTVFLFLMGAGGYAGDVSLYVLFVQKGLDCLYFIYALVYTIRRCVRKEYIVTSKTNNADIYYRRSE